LLRFIYTSSELTPVFRTIHDDCIIVRGQIAPLEGHLIILLYEVYGFKVMEIAQILQLTCPPTGALPGRRGHGLPGEAHQPETAPGGFCKGRLLARGR
jgi:hypothetical protein